ncbi:hypothetical protein SmphiM6_25 [Sinorhizobium phage phiM6]|nr:hypothetical protein SmphiM6_25 [Sinorhizobium phage phiM6]
MASSTVQNPTATATNSQYTKENFPYEDYIKENPKIIQGTPNSIGDAEKRRAWEQYTSGGSSWKPTAATPTPPKPVVGSQPTTPVPGTPDPKDPSQLNVVDYAGQIAADPSKALTKDDPKTTGVNESMRAEDHLKAGTAANVNPNDPKFAMGQTPTVNSQQVNQQTPTQANTYEVDKTQEKVGQNQMEAAKGQLSQNAQVQAEQVDMKGVATGVNADGSINYLGQQLNKHASQNMSNIIDTSTAAGKLLAEQLGEGNYLDSKATLQGQLEMLQSQFVDPATGEPKIPTWAAGTARNVSKIAAFSGMTGTAATAAMSQALMEASIPIAQQDAQFFQTLTLKNLDNKQQSIINTANVLAKFEQTNVDNRMAAAIQNSKNFLEMDLKNLDNEQQARVINNQSMIQSILEDSKAENAKRLFTADSQNDLDKFYAQLNTQINQFNSSQTLDADKFNANMEDSREKFYKEMQYNIAISNAKWRQEVQLQDDQQAHEAATQDVKNMVDISNNQLNQIWDRSDSLLDYIWQSSEKEADRKAQMAIANMQIKAQKSSANSSALGGLLGTFIGSKTGEKALDKVFSIFG